MYIEVYLCVYDASTRADEGLVFPRHVSSFHSNQQPCTKMMTVKRVQKDCCNEQSSVIGWRFCFRFWMPRDEMSIAGEKTLELLYADQIGAVFCLFCSAGALMGLLEHVVAKGGLLRSVSFIRPDSFWRVKRWEASAADYPNFGRTPVPVFIESRRLEPPFVAFSLQMWLLGSCSR